MSTADLGVAPSVDLGSSSVDLASSIDLASPLTDLAVAATDLSIASPDLATATGNGTCVSPYLIAAGGGVYPFTMNGSGTQTGSCGSSAGVERILAWTPTQTGNATLKYTTDYWPATLYVRKTACGGVEQLCQGISTAWPQFNLTLPVTAGVTYYIIADGFYSGTVVLSGTLTVTPAP